MDHLLKEITVRELILGVARGLGLMGDTQDGEGPCNDRKQENCKAMYGPYFEATCELCPERRALNG